MHAIIPHRSTFMNMRPPWCVGPHDLFSVLGQDGCVRTFEGDGGLAVVCVVIGTEEVVPTEA